MKSQSSNNVAPLNIFITGEAGTGESHLVKTLIISFR